MSSEYAKLLIDVPSNFTPSSADNIFITLTIFPRTRLKIVGDSASSCHRSMFTIITLNSILSILTFAIILFKLVLISPISFCGTRKCTKIV